MWSNPYASGWPELAALIVVRTLHRLAHVGAFSFCVLVGSVSVSAVGAVVQNIVLPPETAVLRTSALPGYQIAMHKCGICHSADYINLQPPRMSLTQWEAEMTKMQHAYGAPIDETEIKLLAIYLASAYGDATTVTAADAALTLPGTAVAASATPAASRTDGDSGAAIDAHGVLDRNGCLGCHALQQKAVGPAYHDVAVKYHGDPQAASKVEANIRAGGVGRWGAIPMPPFPNLSPPELQALAAFVLQQ